MKPNLMEPLSGLRLSTGEITNGDRPKRTLRQRNVRVARAFDLTGKRVLDLGCAEGLHSLYMAESAREVVGVDHRACVISRANANKRALGILNVTFQCGDIRDSQLLERIGEFDLVVAWGFLHRVTDIFSLLQTLSTITKAFSLEWRTPAVPLLSRISFAYHSPAGDALDPMNLGPVQTGGRPDLTFPMQLPDKIEGDTGFWEPTPGAVRVMLRRLGFPHSRLLGYGEFLRSEGHMMIRNWSGHFLKTVSGKTTHQLPLARVHMMFEKTPGYIPIRDPFGQEIRLPEWDHALQLSLNATRKRTRIRFPGIRRQAFPHTPLPHPATVSSTSNPIMFNSAPKPTQRLNADVRQM